MAYTRLIQAVCAVAMLSTAPAFAQTNTQPADTGAGNTLNDPTGVAAPAQTHAPAANYSTHASGRHRGALHARNGQAGNAAVDRLNQQSYDAARSGQSFAPAATTNQ